MKGILLISWVALLVAPLSHACVCLPPKHPQEHFCESEFGRIMSGKMFIGLCGLHVEDDVKSLNKRQKAGFFRKYKDNCDCKIQYCAGKRCPPDNDDQCSIKSFLSFDDFMNCANRYSMCRRRNGKCQWTKNRKHTLCQNQALRRRYLRH